MNPEDLLNEGASQQQPAIKSPLLSLERNLKVFNDTGKLMEKYNVVDTDAKAGGGEYPLQDGFGWTNGVLLNLLNRYHTDQQ